MEKSNTGKVFSYVPRIILPSQVERDIDSRVCEFRSDIGDTKRPREIRCSRSGRGYHIPHSVSPYLSASHRTSRLSNTNASQEWSGFNAELAEKESPDEVSLTITLTIENTGQMDGAEVIQIYIQDLISSMRRPRKELKGFKKVFLAAGEKTTVSLNLDKLALAFFNDHSERWVMEKGDFRVIASRSSRDRDIVLEQKITLNSDYAWTGL
jgi:hypothetical protein